MRANRLHDRVTTALALLALSAAALTSATAGAAQRKVLVENFTSFG